MAYLYDRRGFTSHKECIFLGGITKMKKHGLAALVELGFMDNAEEFNKLNQPAYQYKLIKGLVQGIQAYFGKA